MTTAFETAMQHHRAGRLGDAERLYAEALSQDPNDPRAAFLLGVLALESGRLESARDLFLRATTLAPKNAAYHANLGETARRLGRYDDAADAFLKAMALQPDLYAPVYNLGLLFHEVGELDGALACFERAAELRPDLIEVRHQIERVRQDPRLQSAQGLRSAWATPGSSATTFVVLATCLRNQGRLEDAISVLRRAIELAPDFVDAYCNLGNMFVESGRLDESIVSYRRALEIDPRIQQVHGNLANVLVSTGRIGEAIEWYRTAWTLRPEDPVHRSNYVYNLHYSADYDAQAILQEARAWDRQHGLPLASEMVPHRNDRAPERRLRVGYVSPDFRHHCQAFYLFPLLDHHDHKQCEIFCYSDVARPDDFTARLLGFADQWRSLVGMDDAQAAARIRDDGIDVLIDLTMHMGNNRLRVFARKPAPVQICWLAYPGTTGVRAMDYRLTDPFLDPPESDTSCYSERSLRLDDTFWCYHPLVSEQAVSPLPARSSGNIVFGCLNNFCKVGDAVIALWSRVLKAVDGSRLVVLVPPGEARSRTLAAFETQGIAPERIAFVAHQQRLDYLATYRAIDVCLDTFPYNGHTTSLDAFWMGVPVVTLVGPTVVGRAGLSQAMNLGLPDLVARTPDEYVKIAVDLCGDLSRLADLRAGLRARIEKSPLMDAPRFARSIEAAYRKTWRAWCAG